MTKFLTKAAFAATAATMFVATPAMAEDETFNATATIVKPLTFVNESALDFGTITMNPSLVSETVTVSATGGAAVCGSAALTCLGGSPAEFTLTGVADQTIELAYDTPPSALTHSSGTGTVPLTLDTLADVDLDDTGAATFFIGGQITVAAATVDGVYDADVNITAIYK